MISSVVGDDVASRGDSRIGECYTGTTRKGEKTTLIITFTSTICKSRNNKNSHSRYSEVEYKLTRIRHGLFQG